jgi:hypothetical protein
VTVQNQQQMRSVATLLALILLEAIHANAIDQIGASSIHAIFSEARGQDFGSTGADEYWTVGVFDIRSIQQNSTHETNANESTPNNNTQLVKSCSDGICDQDWEFTEVRDILLSRESHCS